MMQRKGKRGMSLHTHLSGVISTNYSSQKLETLEIEQIGQLWIKFSSDLIGCYARSHFRTKFVWRLMGHIR